MWRNRGSVSEYAEHRAVGLLLGEEPRVVFVVGLVAVDDDVLRGGDQAVLDASEPAERLLVGSRVEESDVLRVPGFEFREEDGVRVALRVVEVLAVAGQSAQQHALVLLVPVVDGEHDVALVDAPGVGQRGDERRVDHVPVLAVVLLFLVDDRVERGAAFAHGERPEFGEDVGFLDAVSLADVLDLGDDLLGEVLVVVLEVQGVLDRETAADVEAVELGADGLEFAVDVHALRQLVPVVGGVLDAGIDEEVQHLELELLAVLEFGLVEGDDVVVADSEARGVEVELGLLLAGDADSDLALLGEGVLEEVELLLVVQHGDRVGEPVVDELGDVLDILRAFESVADDVPVLVDDAAVVEGVDDMDVVGRGGFEVDVVLHGLFEHEGEVARLGAVAVVVRPLVVDLGHRHVEHALGAVDLLGDLRQVGDLERSSVLFDEFHEGDVMEIELVVLDGELVLREVERLFDQIDVLVFHGRFRDIFPIRLGYIAEFRRK